MKRLLPCLIALFVTSPAAVRAAGPNILHIHADDHRPDGLHALGTPALKTPHLDALVARGMTFARCYTMGSMVGAVCTPSRTMMLTGRSWQRIPGAPGATANAAEGEGRDILSVEKNVPFLRGEKARKKHCQRRFS